MDNFIYEDHMGKESEDCLGSGKAEDYMEEGPFFQVDLNLYSVLD